VGTVGRCECLLGAAHVFLDRAEEIGHLITVEMGKPLAESVSEVRSCGQGLEGELLEIQEALAPEVIEDGRLRSIVYRDPFGVCAAITPWNFPFSMPHWMVLPALAAGNSVILKPSEETPLTGQAYVDIVGALLPNGVLQIAHGGDEQGKALVRSDLDLIAFTGSREAGKDILRSASDGLRRVILELGGKDPLIVLEDADIEKAATFAAWNSFRNAGQVCVSTERIFVCEAVEERFEHLLAEASSRRVVGNGLKPGTTIGPMVNERQRDHVLRHIEDAVSRGARVLAGGSGHHDNFVVPTVLTGVTDEMAIAREETFGPVACITRVANEEEAIRRANDTPFGLGAVVFGSQERASQVARHLRAGMVGVNRGVHGAKGAPWVGARESGYGFHKSRDGHRQFTQTRVVTQGR
jgi:succinate-semialdehyde dehydrogenase/glutarate-semialdehyde dehydrogenase